MPAASSAPFSNLTPRKTFAHFEQTVKAAKAELMAAVWDGVGLRDEAEVTYVSNMSLVYQATQARLRQVRAAEPEQARGRSYWELHHCVCERRVRRRERVRGAPWWSLECMCVLTAFRQLCLCCDRRPALLPAVASGGSFPAPPPPPPMHPVLMSQLVLSAICSSPRQTREGCRGPRNVAVAMLSC